MKTMRHGAEYIDYRFPSASLPMYLTRVDLQHNYVRDDRDAWVLEPGESQLANCKKSDGVNLRNRRYETGHFGTASLAPPRTNLRA